MNTIDFAISMEEDGRRYYLEQAERNKDNELRTVFLLLADSEKDHAELLRQYKNREDISLQGNFVGLELKSVFHGMKIFHKEDSDRQKEVYRIACEQEEKSIHLYKELEAQARDEFDRELFRYLILQEEGHLALFEELVRLVTRPEEWVESAEFGLREEY